MFFEIELYNIILLNSFDFIYIKFKIVQIMKSDSKIVSIFRSLFLFFKY